MFKVLGPALSRTWKWLKVLGLALSLTWKWLAIVLALAVLASYAFSYVDLTLYVNTLRLFFGIKVAVVSIVTSAILFWYRFFWEDSAKMQVKEYPKLVSYYKRPFISLFLVDILAFVSLAADPFKIFLKNASYVECISAGCFAVSLLLLLIFVLYFYTRVFAELETLRRAGTKHD